jgi:hypothetical protein
VKVDLPVVAPDGLRMVAREVEQLAVEVDEREPT